MENNGPKSQDLEKDEAGETRDEPQSETPVRTPSVPPAEPNLLDVKYALAMSRAVDNSQPENDDEDEGEEKEKEKDDNQEEKDKLAKEKGRATWVSLSNESSNDDNSTIRPGVVYQRHAKEETTTESAELAEDPSGIVPPPTTPSLVEQSSTGSFVPGTEMATITTAHLVEEDAGSGVPAPAEAPDETLEVPARAEPKSDRSKWYGGGAMVLLIIVLVVTTSLLATRPGKSDSSDKATTSSQPKKPVEKVYAAFTSTEELYDAVDEYLLALQANEGNETNTAAALAQINVSLTYGFPIGTWDVSRLTNFSRVFDPDRSAVLEPFRFLPENTSTFNEDLGDWDVSNAVTMRGMFACAVNFRGFGLDRWNVGRVQDFSYMMARAQAFEADISAWDTSSATTMEAMMFETMVFNGNVTEWDVSNVESMAYMFSSALRFQGGDLRQWNVSKVHDMSELFGLNWAFIGNVSTWDTSRVTTFFNMVRSVVSPRE
jgi:surface protein